MNSVVLSVLVFFMMTTAAIAGHPLVTDDTGTQGMGKGQVEVGVSFFHDKDEVDEISTFKNDGGEVTVGVTVGVLDTVDVVLGVPYAWNTIEENDVRNSRADGISDINFDLKWRFFEKKGWSLALKPGVSLPSGDDDKGLGAGRTACRMLLIGTREFSSVALHANVGYIRNENNADERRDIWHASLAAEAEVIKNLKLLANVGIERNPATEENHPIFALGGVSYEISERITIDAGVKSGLTKPETDVTYLAGLTVKF